MDNHPLEADFVERPLTVIVEGRTVTGVACANWGVVEVDITSPIASLTRGRDVRGWCFAMTCHHWPEYRFAFGGEFTTRGVQVAESMLSGMYLDWLAVSRQSGEVDAACRRTRQEIAGLEQMFAGRTQPLHEERTALRRQFKAGELTQKQYQARVKEIGKCLDRIDHERRDTEAAVRQRFAVWLEGRCGRRVSLDEAERLLVEVAVVVEAGRP